MALLALALIIGLGKDPALGLALRKAEARLFTLRTEKNKTEAALAQLQSDIEEAKKMQGKIDAKEADKILEPTDRLRTAKLMERRATEAGLTRFTYSISPERKTPIDTVGSGKQDFAESVVGIEADAPTDIEAYAFLEALRREMPGRFALHTLRLERTDKNDAPITNANVHMKASGKWLANGAGGDLTERKK